MAKEYMLPYRAEEIETRLDKAGDAVLSTPQTLTDEQKAQVRANIGAAEESGDSQQSIRLTDYGSLNESVSNLVFSGGGTLKIEASDVMDRFWDDVFRKRPTEVIMGYGVMDCVQRGATLLLDDTKAIQFGYSGLILYNTTTSTMLDVKVLFHRDSMVSSSCTLYVRVGMTPM